MSVGNRIFLERDLPDLKVIEGFKNLHTANVADTMERLPALSSEIKLISNPKKETMVGAALTVKVRPGDNLMLHKALNIAGPNDVIIVSNDGDRTHSLMGEIMTVFAHYSRKVAGIVLDAPIRDFDELSKMDMFLYATGATPGGPYKHGPGEINVPISIGNVAVMPGDIVLGDRDGVIIIPRKDAPQILEESVKYAEFDASKVEAAKNGTANRKWVDETLEKIKAEIISGKYDG